jgi:aspartyl-tRNA(Asn)/glutamyl-tRNA(Gln) amidotransferase subunit A
MTDIAFTDLQTLAGALLRGELSPVELTRYYLERIERYNGAFNAYLHVEPERALAAARAAEQALAAGDSAGPLHGIPIALKDLIDVAGMPTTGGSIAYHDVPERDSTVTRRLRQAGAIVLGKTHQVELAFGGVGTNSHYGTPWNPWDTETHRAPGGSSSGSAVSVAADLAPAAIGTDTGGSVRIPAALCGLVGLKPTFGRVSKAGLMPLDSGLDSAGPLARTVADAAVLYQAIAGPDTDDSSTHTQSPEDVLARLYDDVAGMRVCIPREYFWEDVDPEIEAAVRASVQTFADLGVHVDEIAIEELDDVAEVRARGRLVAVEAYLNFGAEIKADPDAFDPVVLSRIMAGESMQAFEYLNIKRNNQRLRERLAGSIRHVDALLTPTVPLVAPAVADLEDAQCYAETNMLLLRNTSVVNLLGLCALSLPCGFTRNGLPIGLQLIAPAFGEQQVLRLGQAYEQATEWHQHHPDLEALEDDSAG